MHPISIHPDDDMFTGSLDHYESCGLQFADFVGKAAALSGAPSPRVLELPCGYGRVTRHLVKRFDPAKIEVADIMAPAVDHTTKVFAVTGHYVVEPVNEFRGIQDGAFDIAGMGSLLTHLSENNAEIVLRNFLGKLSANGVAVVTTHGERAYELLAANAWFELTPNDRTTLLDAYSSGSYGFANYAPKQLFEKRTVDYIGESYGVSLTSYAWMLQTLDRLGYKVLEFLPGAWDNHQDVFWVSRA